MCEQGILDRGVSEGCDFRRLDTYEEGTPPPERVHLPRKEYTSPDRVRLQVMWCLTTTVRNASLDTYEEGTPPPDRVHLPRIEYTSPGQGTPPSDRVHLQVMWCSTTTVRNEFPDTSEEGAPPGKILTMLSHVIANKSVVV
ncbi:hypothetical protein ACET3Z_015855 [Daucus carota]